MQGERESERESEREREKQIYIHIHYVYTCEEKKTNVYYISYRDITYSN